jgi:hypothetical protein
MKTKAIFLSLAMAAALLAGCGAQTQQAAAPAATATTTAAPAKTDATKADAVTGASQINDEVAFEKAISKDNSNYMVIVNKNLTFTKDLIVEDGIKKGTNGAADAPNRSIAPAAETKDNKITDRYTVTVPNLVFKGENGKIEYGILKGDVYVQAKGFILKDATIDGNLYFANDDLKNAFKQDATSKITGQIAVKAYTK